MPTLARASPDRELERLIRLYLRAENNIINEIGRLRSQGLVDYHAVAALERVQAILRQLESDCWEYVPRMVEAQFYVRRPEARAQPGETVKKHLRGYQNASRDLPRDAGQARDQQGAEHAAQQTEQKQVDRIAVQ